MPNAQVLISKYRAREAKPAAGFSGSQASSDAEAVSARLEELAAAAALKLQTDFRPSAAASDPMQTAANLADERMLSAQAQAWQRYASAMLHINRRKESDADSSARNELAKTALQKTLLNSVRERDDAVRSESSTLIRRKESAIGFSNLDEEWRRDMIAGAKEQFAGYAGVSDTKAEHSISGFASALVDPASARAHSNPPSDVDKGSGEIVNLLTQILNELRTQTPKLGNLGALT